MKLRNKRTGEIGELMTENYEFDGFWVRTGGDNCPDYKDINYYSLAELNAEWEDYEEPKGSALDLMILTLTNFIENEPDDTLIDLEDCKQMLEKLKAWKKLKDKGYYFKGWRLDKLHFEIELRVKEYDFITDERKQDLDLLFGSEDKDQ